MLRAQLFLSYHLILLPYHDQRYSGSVATVLNVATVYPESLVPFSWYTHVPVVEEERETAGVAAGKPGCVPPKLPDMKIVFLWRLP